METQKILEKKSRNMTIRIKPSVQEWLYRFQDRFHVNPSALLENLIENYMVAAERKGSPIEFPVRIEHDDTDEKR